MLNRLLLWNLVIAKSTFNVLVFWQKKKFLQFLSNSSILRFWQIFRYLSVTSDGQTHGRTHLQIWGSYFVAFRAFNYPDTGTLSINHCGTKIPNREYSLSVWVSMISAKLIHRIAWLIILNVTQPVIISPLHTFHSFLRSQGIGWKATG